VGLGHPISAIPKFNLLARRASRLAAALILISATPTLSEAQFAAAGQPGSTSGACASPPSQVGGVGGVQWAPAVSGAACAGAQPSAGLGNGTPPSPPYVGVPPLAFHGGPVAGTTTPGELTVTPVYWVPSGGTHTIPAGYRRLINKFIADSATDSGKPTDVFSSVTQYTTSEGPPQVQAARRNTGHRHQRLPRQWLNARRWPHLVGRDDLLDVHHQRPAAERGAQLHEGTWPAQPRPSPPLHVLRA
jgi:hypothetical protein